MANQKIAKHGFVGFWSAEIVRLTFNQRQQFKSSPIPEEKNMDKHRLLHLLSL